MAPYHNIAAHKGLEKGGLACPPWSDHLAKKHWPLRLALIQVHLSLSCHYTIKEAEE